MVVFYWITFFLLSCVVTDIIYGKVFNKAIIASLIISLSFLLAFYHPEFWLNSALSFFITSVLGLTLFKFKVFGAGDIKAMLVVVLFLSPVQTLNFFIYSIIWGGVFSLIYFSVRGSVLSVTLNTAGVYKKINYAVHKVPFTIGIILGWLSLSILGIWS